MSESDADSETNGVAGSSEGDTSRPVRPSSSRRAFLTGRAARQELEAAGDRLADELVASQRNAPASKSTVRLTTRAMASDFTLLLNEPLTEGVPFWRLSDALERVHGLEQLMTIYRDDSDLMAVNRNASSEDVVVPELLFDVLLQAKRISEQTGGAYDPTSGPLVALWKSARQSGQLPTQEQIDSALDSIGAGHLTLEAASRSVRFRNSALSIDLGGIGKGFALDQMIADIVEAGEKNCLLHGGHSSLIARGSHTETEGWPIGIRNPLLPKESLGTMLLQDRAFSASGSGVQFFRLGGKRYGHILDPRTGWPASGMLSVVVTATSAAEADALSTAFYVLGVENTLAICDTLMGVGVLLIPLSRFGKRLQVIVRGIPPEHLFLNCDDIEFRD